MARLARAFRLAQVFDVGLTLATDSLVEIELGGLTPVAEYDQLIVNQFGTANLGGTLDLSLINGFVPQDGDAFTILTAGVISGSFMDDLVTPVNFPTGVTFEVIYEAKKVVLQFDVQFISADFDIDGDIDGHDFLVWQRGGSPNPLSNADLALWRAQFGVGALSTASGVPEPGGLTLAVFLLLGVANRNRP